jgi:hypothetical protein
VAVALQGVFVDPADTGGIGTQGGGHPLGQAAGNEIQVLQHTAAGPVKVGTVLENDVDERNAEKGEPAHHLGKGYRQHGRGQRVGDLVFHHLGRLTGVFGKDDHLHVGQVGNGVQGGAGDGVNAGGDDEQGRQDHQELVLTDSSMILAIMAWFPLQGRCFRCTAI